MRSLCMLALTLTASAAAAQVPNEALVCPAEEEVLDKVRYLRALSLDITGGLPTEAELQTVVASEDVPDAMIDALLDSPEFARRVVRRHLDLLWPNVDAVRLTAASVALRRTGTLYWVLGRSTRYRGDNVSCLDEPATFNADGSLKTKKSVDPANGTVSYREGWVEVVPYWSNDTVIKACAFDAQDALVSASGTDCARREGINDAGCGCGPNMRWCRYNNTERQVTAAMQRELEMRIEALILEDRPYTDLFTDNTAWVNGPLVHQLKHLAEMYAQVRLQPLPFDDGTLPDLHFTDEDTWVPIELPEYHAGILTSWAFLLRFQTNRARANRFYNAFLCEPFQPPAGGIPFDDSQAAHEADLQKRSGCKYCHSLLEPSASFWGRWAENGAGFLDPQGFPPLRQDCLTCAMSGQSCNADCNLYYVTHAGSPSQQPFLGKLGAYEFRRPEHEAHVEMGPRVLALQTVVDHRLPTCVARRTAEWLLGRELQPDEGGWLDALAVDFVASGYRYRDLVRAVLTSDTYRRVR